MPSPPQVNCRVLLLKEMAENEHDNGKEHRSYSSSAACRKMSSIGVGSGRYVLLQRPQRTDSRVSSPPAHSNPEW